MPLFVTYSDLIQIGIFIVTLVGLCYTVFGKRTVPAITIIVGPVKTQFGYHLIKVEKKNEASKVPFAEAEPGIRQNLMQQKQNVAYTAKGEALKAKYM